MSRHHDEGHDPAARRRPHESKQRHARSPDGDDEPPRRKPRFRHQDTGRFDWRRWPTDDAAE